MLWPTCDFGAVLILYAEPLGSARSCVRGRARTLTDLRTRRTARSTDALEMRRVQVVARTGWPSSRAHSADCARQGYHQLTRGSPRPTAGHDKMTRPSRRGPLGVLFADSGSETWGQRESARRGAGHLNRSPPRLGALKGGLDVAATHAGHRSRRIEHPDRSLTRRACTCSVQARMLLSAHMAPSS
jgi:hypothetical protein